MRVRITTFLPVPLLVLFGVFYLMCLRFLTADVGQVRKEHRPSNNHHHLSSRRSIRISVYDANSAKHDRLNANRIFFHAANAKKSLNLYESCAIESAAKHNPERPVQLFLLDGETIDHSSAWWQVLSRYANVEMILINEHDYFRRHAQLGEWYQRGEWRKSPFAHEHLSDFLRLASSAKAGGLSLDLNAITVKRYSDELFKNCFVVDDQEAYGVGSSVFHLDSDHRFLQEMFDKMTANYDHRVSQHYFGDMITALMHHFCGFKRKNATLINSCDDVSLHPYETVALLHHSEYGKTLEKALDDPLALFSRETAAFRYWTGVAYQKYSELFYDELFAVLAKNHCPITLSQGSVFMNDKSVYLKDADCGLT